MIIVMVFARKLRKLLNMGVTVVAVVIGTLGTVPKGLESRLKELEILGQIEPIQTIALVSLARILRRVLET